MARGGKREGAGRPAGAITKRTREVAERALATGMSPLDVMLDNMRHFQQVALDAEATLEGMTADEFSEQVSPNASPEDQFKFLLAQVKKTAGFRQMAQDAARDAAPYVHPKLASVEHSGPNGGPIKLNILPEDAEL
ncbi:hypothetical protein [Sinorhizobium meliloti]|uniref:hypothetical protein n=1 Tax=Rhizobium meliloti TaxID=382 RepID=UPI000FD9E233|nr:hypothetical protein [Sinorhizobium meliloti]RVH27881.1 hypothetical protein CN211_26490 [Sinorhizobium meliloti]